MPMTKQRGKVAIAVVRSVEKRETVSPGTRESKGLMAFMEMTVGMASSAMRTNAATNAPLNLRILPAKLPKPAQSSQKESVIPMSSSFPEKVASSIRRTIIWRSMEEKPMTTKGADNRSACMLIRL